MNPNFIMHNPKLFSDQTPMRDHSVLHGLSVIGSDVNISSFMSVPFTSESLCHYTWYHGIEMLSSRCNSQQQMLNCKKGTKIFYV